MAGTATIAWIGNPAGAGLTFVGVNATSANNVTAPSQVGVPAGALMVLTCAAADDSTVATTVNITGTTLTWTKRVTNTAAVHSGSKEVWTAPCPAGGTVTPTCTWVGSTQASSAVLYYVTGQEAVTGGTNNEATLQGAPSVAVTTGRNNSVLFCVSSDWNAVAPGTPTYRDSATQQLLHNLSPSTYVGYHYYKITTTLGSYTEGISSPSTMAAGTGVYEVRTP